MTRPRIGVLALAFALVAGCSIGGNLDEAPSSRSPAGARTTLHFRVGQRTVELLTVDDSMLLVMHRDSLKTIPWRGIRRIDIHGIEEYTPPYREDARAEILRVSRFPYGISDDVMTALLAKSGQTAPAVLE